MISKRGEAPLPEVTAWILTNLGGGTLGWQSKHRSYLEQNFQNS